MLYRNKWNLYYVYNIMFYNQFKVLIILMYTEVTIIIMNNLHKSVNIY